MGCISGSPLHLAATRGHVHFVEELLLGNPELAEVLDLRQRSVLHLAAAKGHLSIAQALVEASREMCLARDRDGRNPLHVAAANGKVAVLEMLLNKISGPGFVNAKDSDGNTILHLAVSEKQSEYRKGNSIEGDDLVSTIN